MCDFEFTSNYIEDPSTSDVAYKYEQLFIFKAEISQTSLLILILFSDFTSFFQIFSKSYSINYLS